jgi:hypothetical protein
MISTHSQTHFTAKIFFIIISPFFSSLSLNITKTKGFVISLKLKVSFPHLKTSFFFRRFVYFGIALCEISLRKLFSCLFVSSSTDRILAAKNLESSAAHYRSNMHDAFAKAAALGTASTDCSHHCSCCCSV